MYKEISQKLIDFIDRSPSCYHVVQNITDELTSAGFISLNEGEHWDLTPGCSYFVTRNASSLIAFRIPEEHFYGFQIIASHSDSPTFKLKENPELPGAGNTIRLNVEGYGGMICSSWFDRPLSIAGRVLVEQEGRIRTKLVNIERDLLLIPSLAIHMNREVNKSYSYNVQNDLLPLFCQDNSKGMFQKLLLEYMGVKEDSLCGMDLFLYNRVKGTIWGAEEEYLSCSRLDDLQCAFASLKGFLQAEVCLSVPVYCVFDNEEVGSGTRQGAASTFLKDTLTRINSALNGTPEDYLMALASSFLISADNAHAVHPGFPEKADPIHRPCLNEGIVIKHSANQKYTSDGVSSAIFKTICRRAQIPFQTFVNHSDSKGGSTLGNISSAQVPLNAVDIGLPQLAMHSAYETAGVRDTAWLIKAAEEFYSSAIRLYPDNSYEICRE